MSLLYYLLFTVSIISNKHFQEEIPLVFLKLEGEWQQVGMPDNFEIWEKEGKRLSSESYKIVEGKKKILETAIIEFSGNAWYFKPNVSHNQGPVNFLITDFGENHFYSENPDHDFPKWIRYEISISDSLNVLIGDQKDSVKFSFSRSDRIK